MDPHSKIVSQRDGESHPSSDTHHRTRYRSIHKRSTGRGTLANWQAGSESSHKGQRRIRYRSIRKRRPSRYVIKEMRRKHTAIRSCYIIAIILSVIALYVALPGATKSSVLFHCFMALGVVMLLCGPLLLRCMSALHEDNCYEDLAGNVFKFNFTPNWPLRLALASIVLSLLIVALGIHYNGDSIKTYYELSAKSDWNTTSSSDNTNPNNVDFIDDFIDSISGLFGL